MARVLQRLAFESHPIINRLVCCIEHDGDVIHFDEAEITRAAEQALCTVIELELPRFTYLPDVRLDFACRRHLVECAGRQVPERWTP
jgi:hypothetical protein